MTTHDTKLAPLAIPPKTQHVPIIGSLPFILSQKLDFIMAEQTRLGDVFTLDLGFMSMIMVCHPRHAQYVLRDHVENYDKGGPFWNAMRQIAGSGLVTNNDHGFWLRQRRMMQPHFHRQRLFEMTSVMVEAIDGIVTDLDKLAEAEDTFDVSDYISRMTMNVILGTLFSVYLKPEEIAEAGQITTRAFKSLFPAVVAGSVPSWLPLPGKKEFKENIAVLDELIYRVLARCRADHDAAHGVIGLLMDMVDEETNEQMTDQQLRDEAVTLFLAGYETTATTLGWALHFLNQNPEIKARAYAEVDEVLGDRSPTFTDLPNLNYLYRVLQETLRLRGPGYWLPRTAIADDEIDGYHIPANKMVVVMISNIHHHPEVWSDPYTFDPDRFLPENMNKRSQFGYIPFGGGQRQCIGRDFSLLEGQLILTRMLQRYEFEADPKHKIRPYFIAPVQRPNAVRITLKRRNR